MFAHSVNLTSINKQHYMQDCTFSSYSSSPASFSFGRTGSDVFLPPVLSVKLWKGQMSSGGQFLHHLNTWNCVGCLQWSDGAGSKTQSDRPRSRHKGKELWAELWRVSVLADAFTIYLHMHVCLCVWAGWLSSRSLSLCLHTLFGTLWVYIHLHSGIISELLLDLCLTTVRKAFDSSLSFCLSSHTSDYRFFYIQTRL